MSRSLKVCLVSPYDFVHPGGVSEHVRHLAEDQGEVLASFARLAEVRAALATA